MSTPHSEDADIASPAAVTTKRLLLRRWRRDDLEPLTALFATVEMWWFPHRRGLDAAETAAFLERRLTEQRDDPTTVWAAEDRSSGELLGYIGLAVPRFLPEVLPAIEVGWRLHPTVWGRGLATEGGRAALAWGFDQLGLEEVVAIVEPENVASRRVMAKLGFVFDQATVHRALGVDLEVHRLRAEAWRARPR